MTASFIEISKAKYKLHRLNAFKIIDLQDYTANLTELGRRVRKKTSTVMSLLKKKTPDAQTKRTPTARTASSHRQQPRAAGLERPPTLGLEQPPAPVNSESESESESVSGRVDDIRANPPSNGAGRLAVGAGHEVPDTTEQERNEAEVAAAHNEAVFFDDATYQVHEGFDNTGGIIGRIKPTKINTPGEVIACYCRMHTCSKIVRVRQAPSQAQILAWFSAGRHVPNGKAHRAAHMRLWPS